MNKRDSEALASRLSSQGYLLTDSEQSADVILLNTCSVRDGAEQKALNKMRMLIGKAAQKPRKPLFGFLGCMAQAHGERLLEEIPGLQIVLGTHRSHKLPEYLDLLLKGEKEKIADCGAMDAPPVFLKDHGVLQEGSEFPLVSAFVNIMHGCDQHCTYCIVPETRGKEFSRPIADVVDECRSLARNGVKEITLLGQIVTSYGKRLIPASPEGLSPFVQLLEEVEKVEGLERIRFTSPHPKGYGLDLVEAYGRLSKLCESAHIPLQSGSNRILKAMRRGYTAERFLEILSQLRSVRPSIGLVTDIIVGFPGETEEDFQETINLVRTARFDNAFIFKYSPRQHTPAAEMPELVPMEIREERHARLLALVNEIARESYQHKVGETMDVLVEGLSRRNVNRLQGRSRCNKIVLFEGPSAWVGTIRKFRIVRAGQYSLYGEPIETEEN